MSLFVNDLRLFIYLFIYFVFSPHLHVSLVINPSITASSSPIPFLPRSLSYWHLPFFILSSLLPFFPPSSSFSYLTLPPLLPYSPSNLPSTPPLYLILPLQDCWCTRGRFSKRSGRWNWSIRGSIRWKNPWWYLRLYRIHTFHWLNVHIRRRVDYFK